MGIRTWAALALAAFSLGCSRDDTSDGKGVTGGAAGSGANGGNGGSGGPSTNGGSGGSGSGGSGGSGGSATCIQATQLWFDDFETNDYSRWTGQDYGNDWKDGFCHANGFSSDQAVSPTHSHRSEITCASDESHRGYGGLQFDGDSVLSGYTNQGTGIDAPNGVVNTFHSWLEAPYVFENGRWFSFWTTNNDCGWNDDVITLGLEDSSNVLTPAHIKSTGGTVTFVNDPPGFPMGQWVRITIYMNYVTGVMAVWQDGQKLLDATFTRSDTDICQWHWGAYASPDNTDVVLYEDDNSIWKLDEPWTNFEVEPWLGESQAVCP
jgi:hypothetical protein